jgi:outer membrane protein assembly factor BamB
VRRRGERVYQERLTRGGTFTASPVAADDKIYFTSEDGEVIVVKAGPTFERLAMNTLGEPVLASAAISQDTIIFRTARHVIAFADTTLASAAKPR